MLKWIVAAVVIFAGYKYWQSRNPQFAGYVATGWGGNAYGNIPSLMNPGVVVGQLTGGMGIGPPGTPFGPSTMTNGGSAGG